jgi:phage shock protein A
MDPKKQALEEKFEAELTELEKKIEELRQQKSQNNPYT